VTNDARLYRFGITPWECHGTAAAASITALPDREETGRSLPLGRALDLGCGRGQCIPGLARRGWRAVRIDNAPAAIEAAAAGIRGAAGLSHVAGDVTRLASARLGTFGFFPGIGCFHGLDAGQRLSEGEGVSALAKSGATLLLSFGPSRRRWLAGRASQTEVQAGARRCSGSHTRAEYRALSWRISIHALEYSLTISPPCGSLAVEYLPSFWWEIRSPTLRCRLFAEVGACGCSRTSGSVRPVW
jgi:SAM-dependent methyltransferase